MFSQGLLDDELTRQY